MSITDERLTTSEHVIVCEGGVILVEANHGNNMGPEYHIKRFDGVYPLGGDFHYTEEEARWAVNATAAEMAEAEERERRERWEREARGLVLVEKASGIFSRDELECLRSTLGSYLRP
jgi:hypothetical protein